LAFTVGMLLYAVQPPAGTVTGTSVDLPAVLPDLEASSFLECM
jgi:hypothetical protein